MSKDRVVFHITPRLIGSSFVDTLRKAFGLTEAEVKILYALRQGDRDDSIKLICRPSQFARFLIWRNEAGCSNSFKELGAKIVPEETQRIKQLDVSERRTANYGETKED